MSILHPKEMCLNFTGINGSSIERIELLNELRALKNLTKMINSDMVNDITMLPLLIESAECKESKIHGKGVFASRNIKCGEIITVYPSDIILKSINNGSSSKVRAGYRMDKIYGENFELDNCKKWVNDYMFDCDKEISIAGDPMLCSDSTFLGHMCNDVAKCPNNKKGIEIYYKVCIARCNGAFLYNDELNIVFVLARQDINKGDEILVSYGHIYWTSKV
jgi:hypothetical protein